MNALENVLVATDFSEPSEVALAYAQKFAGMFGAKLHVLHIVESAVATAAARRQLDVLVSRHIASELRVHKEVRTWTSTPAAIVEYARQADIDLIVMGTHARAFPNFAYGQRCRARGEDGAMSSGDGAAARTRVGRPSPDTTL